MNFFSVQQAEVGVVRTAEELGRVCHAVADALQVGWLDRDTLVDLEMTLTMVAEDLEVILDRHLEECEESEVLRTAAAELKVMNDHLDWTEHYKRFGDPVQIRNHLCRATERALAALESISRDQTADLTLLT